MSSRLSIRCWPKLALHDAARAKPTDRRVSSSCCPCDRSLIESIKDCSTITLHGDTEKQVALLISLVYEANTMLSDADEVSTSLQEVRVLIVDGHTESFSARWPIPQLLTHRCAACRYDMPEVRAGVGRNLANYPLTIDHNFTKVLDSRGAAPVEATYRALRQLRCHRGQHASPPAVSARPRDSADGLICQLRCCTLRQTASNLDRDYRHLCIIVDKHFLNNLLFRFRQEMGCGLGEDPGPSKSAAPRHPSTAHCLRSCESTPKARRPSMSKRIEVVPAG